MQVSAVVVSVTQKGDSEVTAGDVYVGYSSGSTGTYELEGNAKLDVTSSLYAGFGGSGSVTQKGDSDVTADYVYVGRYSGSTGTYELEDNAQLDVTDTLYLDYNGSLTQKDNSRISARSVTQRGNSQVSAENVYIESYYENHLTSAGLSTGSYELEDNAQLYVTNSLLAGYNGIGNVTQKGNSQVFANKVFLGYMSGSTGTYLLEDNAQLDVMNYLLAGYNGTGNITQKDASQVSANFVYLGYKSGSMGTYELEGNAQLEITNSLYVGHFGTGSIRQKDASQVSAKKVYLGYYSGSTGTYVLEDNAQLNVTNYLYAGYNGTGSITHKGNTDVFANIVYLGYSSTATGTYVLEDNAQLDVNKLYAGHYGTGSITQKDASQVSAKKVYLGSYSGSIGSYELEDNAKLNVNTFKIGTSAGEGSLSIKSSDSLITVNEKIDFGNNAHLSCVEGAKIQLNGAAFSISSTIPDNLSDLDKLTLQVTGAGNTLEAASQDAGAWMDNPNYLLNQIAFSGEGVVTVLLEDLYNNDTADELFEAVYCNDILLEENTDGILDLNGLSMYAAELSFEENSSLTIQNGSLIIGDEDNQRSLTGLYTQDIYDELLDSLTSPTMPVAPSAPAPVPEPSVIYLLCTGIFILAPQLRKHCTH